MKNVFRICLFLLFITFCSGTYASGPVAASDSAWRGKIANSLFESVTHEAGRDILVLFENQVDLSEAEGLSWIERGRFVHKTLLRAAEREQAQLIALLKSNPASYRSFTRHIVLNAVSIKGLNDPDLLEPMARLSTVAEIMEAQTLDSGSPVSLTPADAPLTGTPWGVRDIRAPALWNLGVKGEGIVVGSIDTGVRYTHEALAGRYRGGEGDGIDHNYNWFDAVSGSTVPIDESGHGTHTTGTVLGSPPSGIPIGVAPEAKWIACRATDGSGITDEQLLTCMDWMLAPWPLDGSGPADGKPDKRPHVVNNSWGGNSCKDTFNTAVNNWRAAGIFPSFAAGNEGPGCETVNTPGGLAQSFATGAYDSGYGLAPFSSRGPFCSTVQIKPDITAPGTNIYSSWDTGDDAYYWAGGTSMAAPHATGAVALLWSAKPWLVGQQDLTAWALRDTAHPVPDESCDWAVRAMMEGIPNDSPNYSWGYGRLDVLAAYHWRSASIAASPTRQRSMGTNGETFEYTFTLYNQTNASVTVGLRLGTHSWNAVLSADAVSVPAQGSATFTLSHTIPDAPLLDEEAVAVTVSWSGGSAEVYINTKTKSVRRCDCPRQRKDMVFEDFEGAFPPSGWTVVDNLKDERISWVRNDEIGEKNETTGSGYCAAISTWIKTASSWEVNAPLDAELRTAPVDVSSLDPDVSIMLEFDYYLYGGNPDNASVDFSFDNGSTWKSAWIFIPSDESANPKNLNLGSKQGDEILIRFHYAATDACYAPFELDNVRVYACRLPESGVVVCPRPVEDVACPGPKDRSATLHNFSPQAESFDLTYGIDAGQITGPSAIGPVAPGSFESFKVETVMPQGLYGSTVTAFINATGRSSGNEDLERFSTQVGGWKTGTSLPFASANNPVFAHNGRIYVFAGLSRDSGKVGIYDPDTDSWTMGAALDENVIPSPRCGIIGRNAGGETIMTLFPNNDSGYPYLLNVYNVDRDSWSTPDLPKTIGSPLVLPTCVSDLDKNAGYVISNSRFLKYNSADNTVEELPLLSPQRNDAAAWLWNDKICLAGGMTYTSKDEPLASTICYDLEKGVWNLENADLPALPYAWHGMAYDLMNGNPALISGKMGTHGTGAGLRYNPETDEWTALPAAPYAVENGGGASMDGRFYLMGGDNRGALKPYNQIMTECPAQPDQLTITGTVKTPDGSPIADAAIEGVPRPGISNAQGEYALSVPRGWTGSLRVRKPGWIFFPGTADFENLDYDMVDVNFVGLGAR